MLPQKPLIGLIPELLSHIDQNHERFVHYHKLLDIYSGNLLKYIETDLSAELGRRSFERAKHRIPPINILSKLVEKLSRVYGETPTRTCGTNDVDNELMTYYSNELDLDNQLANANELLNLHKYFALEVYLDDGVPDLRILDATKFLVFSDNPLDPTAMTVFIKFMGSIRKTDEKEGFKVVPLFHAYSDDEFIVFDGEGEVHDLKENPFGTIPFVYCSSSSLELIPTPDSDNIKMVTLIPRILADLNYATQFASHGVLYTINADIKDLSMTPDAVWDISAKEGSTDKPEIGNISNTIEVDATLSLISAQMDLWLSSKGLKTGTIGSADTALSGVSKLIDEADASSVSRKQIKQFRKYEKNLWNLIEKMHSYWVSSQQLKEYTKDFSLEFSPFVLFSEPKIITDTKTILEEISIQLELGLITKKQALQKVNPDMSSEQLEELLEALKGSNG